jgi:hypothetical protein
MEEIEQLREVLNNLIHANEDMIDNYGAINHFCEEGKKLLPNYDEKEIFDDYGQFSDY